MHLLLVGSTELVGSHVLKLSLQDERVTKVTVVSRRPLELNHPKLRVEIVNFDLLNEQASWWKADAVICTLGTTMKKAKSKEAFKKVDYEYPLKVGELSYKAGTKTYVLNSATGADANSFFFYNQVKGQLENSLRKIRFESLVLVRPGLIGGKREEFRLGEELAKVVTRILTPILPKSLKMNHPEQIAKSLLESAILAEPGEHIVTAAELNTNFKL